MGMERARGEVRMASCKSRIGGRHGSYYLKWALPEQEEEQRRGEGGETEHRVFTFHQGDRSAVEAEVSSQG